jgi:hypothetical protein
MGFTSFREVTRYILSNRMKLTSQTHFLRSLPKTSSDWEHNDQLIVGIGRQPNCVRRRENSPRHPLAFPRRVACATHCQGVKVERRSPRYGGESSTPKHSLRATTGAWSFGRPDVARRGFSTNGRASRQSNRAQIVRLSREPAPQLFRQVYDVYYRILFDSLTTFWPSLTFQIHMYIHLDQTVPGSCLAG